MAFASLTGATLGLSGFGLPDVHPYEVAPEPSRDPWADRRPLSRNTPWFDRQLYVVTNAVASTCQVDEPVSKAPSVAVRVGAIFPGTEIGSCGFEMRWSECDVSDASSVVGRSRCWWAVS